MYNEKAVIKGICSIIQYESHDGFKASYNTNFLHSELIYFLDGDGYVFFNGKTARDKEGTLRFHPAGKLPEGAEYNVDVIKGGKCIDIYFDAEPELFDEFFSRDMTGKVNLRRMFENIESVWREKNDGYYYRCMSMLHSIFDEITKIDRSYISAEKYEKIKPAIDHIESKLPYGDIDYNSLHELCGISYSYFKRLFVTKFGSPPVKYVTERRIAYARDLLVTGKYSISEISEQTGFENVYYFSRVFKKVTGVSPKNYKECDAVLP